MIKNPLNDTNHSLKSSSTIRKTASGLLVASMLAGASSTARAGEPTLAISLFVAGLAADLIVSETDDVKAAVAVSVDGTDCTPVVKKKSDDGWTLAEATRAASTDCGYLVHGTFRRLTVHQCDRESSEFRRHAYVQLGPLHPFLREYVVGARVDQRPGQFGRFRCLQSLDPRVRPIVHHVLSISADGRYYDHYDEIYWLGERCCRLIVYST